MLSQRGTVCFLARTSVADKRRSRALMATPDLVRTALTATNVHERFDANSRNLRTSITNDANLSPEAELKRKRLSSEMRGSACCGLWPRNSARRCDASSCNCLGVRSWLITVLPLCPFFHCQVSTGTLRRVTFAGARRTKIRRFSPRPAFLRNAPGRIRTAFDPRCS